MKCSYEDCVEELSSKNTSGMCRRHYRIVWGRAHYDPIKQRAYYKTYYDSKRRHDRHIATYGITVEDFDEMVAEQDGKCYLCERPPSPDAKHPANRVLHMDHNHATNQPRRPLCTDCNKGIGMFRDDPDLLRKAAEYLCAMSK